MSAGQASKNCSTDIETQDSFQHLLLEFSAASAQGADHLTLIRLFCESARQFFAVDGIYCWQLVSDRELVAAGCSGYMAEVFQGTHLELSQAPLAARAMDSRTTVYASQADLSACPLVGQFPAKAIMASPLVVSGEVAGVLVFAHVSDPKYFTQDLAAKATILAGVLGSFMEVSRLSRCSLEERRRGEVLVQCAQALHARLDIPSVVNALAERVCSLLQARIVGLLLKEGDGFRLRGMSAANSGLAEELNEDCGKRTCSFARNLASEATETGAPVIVEIDPLAPELPPYLPGGQILAAPILTSKTTGALIIHCGPECRFSNEDRLLVSAIANLGSLAIANAELFETARDQASELQRLLDIASELGSIGEISQFLEKFVVRASQFLGFERSFIALATGESYAIRWVSEGESAFPLRFAIPEALAARISALKEPFWSDDVTKVPGADLQIAEMFSVRQCAIVPLAGSDGRTLGVFGVLDRKTGQAITTEDVRRAKALAAEVSVVLEATQNLHLATQNRRRAEHLVAVALELNSSLRLSEFVQKFTARARDMLETGAGVLALAKDNTFEIAVFEDSRSKPDVAVLRRLSHAIHEAIQSNGDPIVCGSAGQILTQGLASVLHWENVILARLTGASGEIIGVLCLADRRETIGAQDRMLLQALTAHASVALENSRLFTRMDQANRHWIEIFDAISDFIVVHDEANRVLRVNRSFADFIGVKPAELISVNMRALSMATGDQDQPCPFCRAGLESGDEYLHPVLERSYLISTSRIHGGPSEGLRQTIHVIKDVTDRREAERRYRELFDNIQEGLYFSSPGGRFIEVNDALVRMLGYESREELLQVDIPTQLYLSAEHCHRLEQAMNETGVVRNFESVLRCKDGSLIHTLQNAFAVRDPFGNVLQYRGLMMDITELKNFQSELQRERDFSSKILNNTQSLILVVDTAGLISYANRRCYQHGNFKDTGLLGRPLTEIVLPKARESMTEALDATLQGKQVDNLELPILLASGRVAQFSVNLSPMRDDQGAVNSIVVVMTDVTDAAMLQAKLMHTEKMAAVGQLVSGVAHEVNNPLTAVLGFADLLLEQEDVPESAKRDISIILQEAQRTKQIVQNLLSFARQTPPNRQLVRINDIVERTLALRTYDFNNRGITLVANLDRALADVVGDAHQLQQVFLNIVNNAFDAVCETGLQGQIRVETRQNNGSAEIRFSDSGPGIQHPDRIFDPFFTTKEVGKGTGLGLSICYGIIHEHGGEILCHNNEEGKGATFVVRLPLQTAPTVLGEGEQA